MHKSIYEINMLAMLLGVMLVLGVIGCEEPETAEGVSVHAITGDGEECIEELTYDLIAGQHIDAGQVIIRYAENRMMVIFRPEDGWMLLETHLAIGDVPLTRSGNPKIGKFPYQHEFDEPAWNDSYIIWFDDLDIPWFDDCVCEPLVIAAHAVVTRKHCEKALITYPCGDFKTMTMTDSGECIIPPPVCEWDEETAWGDGEEFDGSNWSMYIPFCADAD
jgi:hypothetical protein